MLAPINPDAPVPAPALTGEERAALEDLYRLHVSATRRLARLLGRPDPFKGRDELRAERRRIALTREGEEAS